MNYIKIFENLGYINLKYYIFNLKYFIIVSYKIRDKLKDKCFQFKLFINRFKKIIVNK